MKFKGKKFIILGVICFILSFLIKQFYLKEENVYYFLDIILLNFNNFEEIGFSKLTIPFIAGYLIVISIIFYYISQQLTKVNNSYFLIRFLSKKQYINYLLKEICLEISYFIITWQIVITISILYFYNTISFQVILMSTITIFKILVVIMIVHMFNILIIFLKKKVNPSLPLFLMIIVMCIDFFLGTGMITFNSNNKYDFLYIMIEVITFTLIYFLTRKVYMNMKELGDKE